MIACPQCGKLNPENFNYCLDCGAELIIDSIHSSESQFFIGLSAKSPDIEQAKKDGAKKTLPKVEGLAVADIQSEQPQPTPEQSTTEQPTPEQPTPEQPKSEQPMPEQPTPAKQSLRPGDAVLELSPLDLDPEDLDSEGLDHEGLGEADFSESLDLPADVAQFDSAIDDEFALDDSDFNDDSFDKDINDIKNINDIKDVAENLSEKADQLISVPLSKIENDEIAIIEPIAVMPEHVAEKTTEPDSKNQPKINNNPVPELIEGEPMGFDNDKKNNEAAIELGLDNEGTQKVSLDQPSLAMQVNCKTCGNSLKESDRFCGKCGTPLIEEIDESLGQTMFMHVGSSDSIDQQLVGKLVVLEPNGKEGRSFNLVQGENLCGRTCDSILLDDKYVSPTHCSFIHDEGRMVLRDKDSLNGVFIKVKKQAELKSFSMFRIGQQLLLLKQLGDFDSMPASVSTDETNFYGSPTGGIWGKLLHINYDGDVIDHYILDKETIMIGRDKGDIIFTDDGFISGTHAKISFENGKCLLTDLGSSNGTYLRVDEFELADQDTVVIGKKLMRYKVV